MKSKNLIEDARTIYSLAMVIILYEVYKSEYLISENPLIFIIKSGLLILISTQLIFLYLCGLSLANLKEEFEEKLSEIASDFYTMGFQLSFFIFFLNISFGFIYNSFKNSGYFFALWGKILLLIITLFLVIGAIKIRKKYFEPSDVDGMLYIVIGGWFFGATIFIISKILQAG